MIRRPIIGDGRTARAAVAPIPQTPHWDYLGTIDYATSSMRSLDVPRGPFYTEFALRFTGAPTLAGASNTLANTKRGDELGFIDKIEFVGNGNDVIRTQTPDRAWMWNYMLYGGRQYTEPKCGDGATANFAFDTTMCVPFVMPNRFAYKGIESGLRSGKYGKLQLNVHWGTFTGINGSASAWTTTPKCEVYAHYRTGNPTLGPRLIGTRNTLLTASYSAANSAADVAIPIDRIYRGFLINVQNTSNVDAGALFSDFKVMSGGNQIASIAEPVLRQWEQNRFGKDIGFERALAAGLGSVGRMRQSTTFDQAGWYWFDFCWDGRQTEAFDSNGLSDLKFRFNIAAACNLYILPFELEN